MCSTTQKTTNTGTVSDDNTAYTPPDSEEKEQYYDRHTSSVPQPNKTFLIRDKNSGQLLTLFDGIVRLQPAGTLGSAYHWTCHEREGWLGFKNIAAGRYLGHDKQGILQAMAVHHQEWENFCARNMQEGGYVLLMTTRGKLWPVKMKLEDGLQRLYKAENALVQNGRLWEFVEV
jgi:hypothetical protein